MATTCPPEVNFHAVASVSGIASLRAFSISHHTAGLTRLQDLTIDSEAASQLHAQLGADGIESVVISTCNRAELYWRARASENDHTVVAALAQTIGVAPETLRAVAAQLSGDAAATHLLRVCCGLESLVLGEAEILGQVRAALETSPHAGPFLDGVFRTALRTGRQARAETAIGTGALSVASMGVQWLADHLPLADSRVLVIGAGDVGTKVARHLHSLGTRELIVANRTEARATSLAASVDGRGVGLDAVGPLLSHVDAVVCAAAASSEWLVTTADLQRSVAQNAKRIVVDLAMPSGVEPGDVDGVTRIDLAGLETRVELHRRQREAEIPRVESVIARELQWLHAWARHQTLRPLVSGLRRKAEAIRRAELVRAERELKQDGAVDAAVLDRLSRRLLDQILAIPLAQLEAGDLPLDATHAEYLRRLFALTDTPASDDTDTGGA